MIKRAKKCKFPADVAGQQRVYKYGVSAIEEGPQLEMLKKHLRLNNEYKRAAYEIVRGRESQKWETIDALYPENVTLRNETLAMIASDATMSATSKKALWSKLTEVDYQRPEIQAHYTTAKMWVKIARAESPAYWATKTYIDDAISASAIANMKTHTLPEYAYQDGGTLYHQVISKERLTTAKFMAAEGRAKLRMVPRQPKNLVPSKQDAQMYVLTLPLGEGESIDVVVDMHRPLPAEGFIANVALHCRREGRKYVYHVCFGVVADYVHTDRATSGTVAVDMNWSQHPYGIRAGYWQGDDGQHGEIVLPVAIIARWVKCQEIESTRDQRFNSCVAAVRAWKATIPTTQSGLAEYLAYAHAWKSAKRVHSLLKYWSTHRCAGDEDIYGIVDAYCQHDKHLEDYATGCRRSFANSRDEFYRQFVVGLRRRYKTVVLEGEGGKLMDVVALAQNGYGGRARHMSSPATLRGYMVADMVVKIVPAAYTSRTCHACGDINNELGAASEWTCPGCGAHHDRDHNAALNILASSEGVEITRGPLASTNTLVKVGRDNIAQWSAGVENFNLSQNAQTMLQITGSE